MNDPNSLQDSLGLEVERLREQLAEAEDLLNAIRNGQVDALVVKGPQGESVYTLKGADQTYRTMIESMDEGALVLAEDGAILYCNRRFEKMLHRSFLIGSIVHNLISEEDRERFAHYKSRAFAGEVIRAELNFLTAGGRNLPALIALSLLILDQVTAISMTVTDLTEQKKTEQTLKAYSERLHRKNLELRLRAGQLARLSSELTMTEHRERKRLSRVLHDGLQQHLASAKLRLGCISHQLGNQGVNQALNDVEAMIGESIQLARSLSTDLSPPVLHEAGLIAGLEWLAHSMREKHQLMVELAYDIDSPVDHDIALGEDINIMLFESVRELLFNAAKHARVPWARVSLRQPQGSELHICVSDEGAGFDPDRLKTSGESDTGFGLFSIRERIGMIGGRFTIESAPGKGSRFTLAIPLAGKSVAPTTGPAVFRLPDYDASHAVAANGNIRVLLADDHTLFRDGVARLLKMEPDIEVIGHARNGQEAIELARKLRPNVILMDISMPGVNGIEATRVIHQEAPEIRIIGLSMFEDQEKAQVMQAAGAVAYRSKDCAASELVSAVRA